jgi:putative toxin-antitoxin system antitoxin component (TIGR02293 family)
MYMPSAASAMAPEPDFGLIPQELMAHARETFGDGQKAKSWLATPNRALGNRRPIDLIGSEQGCQQVDEILGRIDHGIYS